jgi:hypothetical protein
LESLRRSILGQNSPSEVGEGAVWEILDLNQ